jgi:hypothetical protein
VKKARAFLASRLDILLAVIGALGSLALIIWFLLTTEGYLYPTVGVLALLACLAYLILKVRMNPLYSRLSHSVSQRTYLLLSICFFLFITLALIFMATRGDVYSRPLEFFLSVTAAFAVLFVEIILTPSSHAYATFILAKAIFLAIILVWSPQSMFPSSLGIDTFFHSQFTQSIINSGHIATNPLYQAYFSFPAMHLNAATAVMLTSLDYRGVMLSFISPLYIICGLSFIYILGSFVYSQKVGLLAALLLGSSTIFIRLGWWMVPNGYATVFVLAITFILFSPRKEQAFGTYVILSIIMIGLILAHSVAALSMFFILLIAWMGTTIYNRLLEPNRVDVLGAFEINIAKQSDNVFTQPQETAWKRIENPLLTFWYVLAFGAATAIWWLASAPIVIGTITDLLKYGLTKDIFVSPVKESVEYGLSVSVWENVLRISSYALLWALAFLGSFAAFAMEYTNRQFFMLACSGLGLLAIGFFSIPFGLSTLPERWQFLSIFFLVIPAAVGIMNVAGITRNKLVGVSLITALVSAYIFISITGPLAVVDKPIWAKKTTVRYAMQESEIKGLHTVLEISRAYNDTEFSYIGADYNLCNYFRYPSLYYIGQELRDKDFTQRRGIVFFRDDVVYNPFSAPGILKLDFNVLELIENQGYFAIYCSDTAHAYLHP